MSDFTISCRKPTLEDSVEDIEITLRTFFYQAGLIFEHMENERIISGNGHHIAQNIASYVIEQYRERSKK